MSDPTITPALTPEGWREETSKLASDEHAGVPRWRSLDSTIAARRGPHALAALCLHEQPFGFTHADIDALERAQEECQAEGWPTNLHSLIARIAALLPPKP